MYVFSTLLVIAFITLILYVIVRMYEIRKEDEKKKQVIPVPMTTLAVRGTSSAGEVGGVIKNDTWFSIRERLLSENNSDWKLAIIEADIYLDKVLDDKGFHGDTTGDKLKQVTPDKLPSIQLAWAAHMVRNRIAHQGAAFVLTRPEARRLLSYFETVFTELGVI